MADEKERKLELESAPPEALPEAEGCQAEETEQAEQAEQAPAQGAEATQAAEEAERVSEEVEALRQKVAELEDKYLRALAELQNVRRRAEMEKAQQLEYANERLLRELLPVVDDLERALAHETDYETLLQGVRMILDKLRSVLSAFGVEPIEAEGKPFDAYLHEAVERVETAEVEEGTIVEEVERGYKYKDRLLRPSRVKVAVAPSGSGEGEGSEGQQQAGG